mmetsp:Transcript_8815/g.26016  ORF Transcript_8815/g.26016 Transcript_8815/m.26016 type:complete len:239 (-) Transcript_8815:234-950(-)
MILPVIVLAGILQKGTPPLPGSRVQTSAIVRPAASTWVQDGWTKVDSAESACLSIAEPPGWYARLSSSHPLAVAAVQSMLLKGIGDRLSIIVGNTAATSSEFGGDPGGGLMSQHTIAMMAVGFTVSGIGGSSWLRHLDAHFGEEATLENVIRKVCADFVCWAPTANAAYLAGVPLLTGHSIDTCLLNAQHELLPVMRLELGMFVPYNVIAFALIPAYARQGTGQVVSLIFAIYLAMRC